MSNSELKKIVAFDQLIDFEMCKFVGGVDELLDQYTELDETDKLYFVTALVHKVQIHKRRFGGAE